MKLLFASNNSAFVSATVNMPTHTQKCLSIQCLLSFRNDSVLLRYARLNFDKYIKTQRTMDKYVNRITLQKKALVFIGSTQFSPSSPIKGYVRCPGLKRLVRCFKKKRNCVVILVDEYRTSQVCGKCFKAFDKKMQPRKRRSRQRICFGCYPGNEMETATHVFVKKNNRRVEKERNAIVNNDDPAEKWTRVVPKNPLGHKVNKDNKNTLRDRADSAGRVVLFEGERDYLNVAFA